ncbi:hypothetical protein LBK6_14830 [Leptospira borgpetersenii serovar Hardjo]|nr:hypothetical protein LBK6_14830 [Leptospira borgpetersenii serovar Hardjo]AWV71258.1 hypothetical protein B9T54_15895 [Leptospira borgpetersenii serovar Hardjo-bovis]TQE54569.1 hypothetical protein FFZ95_03705 [Leptospira borgpetersenii]AMX62775.1 hypothetical protein LBK9_14750 [Leptospira borgpetersenii serovar Hardjo]AMX66018.1 hypothetical protein LBK30_14760 [Leptospira borgpetersenii serovar Hardjo]
MVSFLKMKHFYTFLGTTYESVPTIKSVRKPINHQSIGSEDFTTAMPLPQKTALGRHIRAGLKTLGM